MVDKNQPIIIKKIKKGGHGHHGGAWKVAYADFVTAMMAFFLLLWLVSVSTKEQRSGLADYFTPTQGIKDDVGIGTKGGLTITDEGERRDNKSNPGVVVGGAPSGPTTDILDKKSLIESSADAALFENAMDKMKKNIESDPELATFKENIDAKITPDGLKIDVSDSDKYPMYETNSAKLTVFGETLLKKIGNLVKTLPNHATITGHTDAGKVEKAAGYSNWELSTDRANAARRFLSGQLEPERVSRVIGAADKDLALPSSPMSSKNRRITILLMRGSYLDGQGSSENMREMLTVPTPVDTSKLKKTPPPAAAAPAAEAPPAPQPPSAAALPAVAPTGPAGSATPNGGVTSVPGIANPGRAMHDE